MDVNPRYGNDDVGRDPSAQTSNVKKAPILAAHRLQYRHAQALLQVDGDGGFVLAVVHAQFPELGRAMMQPRLLATQAENFCVASFNLANTLL
jgi:hypothetical protein